MWAVVMGANGRRVGVGVERPDMVDVQKMIQEMEESKKDGFEVDVVNMLLEWST